MALLRAAAACHARGAWPAEWPPPSPKLDLQGVELEPPGAEGAGSAGRRSTVVRGDIREVPLPRSTAIVILDVLLYLAETTRPGCLPVAPRRWSRAACWC